jgi:hypothetical protein
MMQNGVSGWYARLDRTLADRKQQIDIWLTTWEKSLKTFQPIAALLPEDWPTLPANLLTDPGHVLDHLLARHDAESDGRSPRGAHPTPPRLADAVIASEMRESLVNPTKPVQPSSFLMSNLPPGFRQHVQKLNLPNASQETEMDDEAEQQALEDGVRTLSGIPLPVADAAAGGGLFHARLIRLHADAHEDAEPEKRKQDSRRLFSNIQLLDIDPLVVQSTKTRLLLEAIRHELVSFGPETPGKISRKEMEELLDAGVQQGDALQGQWPWEQRPNLVLTNPPWLRIKDRFRGMEDGSQLRKELGEQLRSLMDDGKPRFSTMRGNVNLYRLFIERSLQILSDGGRLRIVAPDSLLREQSSHPLRELLVQGHAWTHAWAIEEANLLFPGMTQGVVVLGITANGEPCSLNLHGPITRADLRREGDGLSSRVPVFELKHERWTSWSRDTWAVPRLPRDRIERKYTLEVLDRLASLPRLSDDEHPLTTNERHVRVRVGEIDQTAHAKHIETWIKGKRSRPFIRGVHFSENEQGQVFIRHPAFRTDIPSRASERQLAMWVGEDHPTYGPRLACQAIVNAHQDRRLRWAVIPEGSVLGNSVNHIELHEDIQHRLVNDHNTIENGLQWLCDHLNNNDLDEWARAWAANNNVNNYELEMLPVELPDFFPQFRTLVG